jgi:hypothetical protein
VFPLKGPAGDDDTAPVDSAPIDAALDAPDAMVHTALCPDTYSELAPLPNKYRVVIKAVTWKEAELDCESDQGHLAVPRDAADMMNYTALVGARAWAGIARNLDDPNDAFRAITNVAFPASLWQTDEPNGTGPVAEIANANGFQMNDGTLFFANRYICECDGRAVVPFDF